MEKCENYKMEEKKTLQTISQEALRHITLTAIFDTHALNHKGYNESYIRKRSRNANKTDFYVVYLLSRKKTLNLSHTWLFGGLF